MKRKKKERLDKHLAKEPRKWLLARFISLTAAVAHARSSNIKHLLYIIISQHQSAIFIGVDLFIARGKKKREMFYSFFFFFPAEKGK